MSGQKAFSEAFDANGIVLSSFRRWVPHAVTRFILLTLKGNSNSQIQIDADPSSIQYPTSPFVSLDIIPTIPFDDIVRIARLNFRNVRLVTYNN